MPTLQDAVRKVAPKADPRFLAALNDRCDAEVNARGLASPEVAARFLAQCHHETSGFREFIENMNYSAKRLTQVWPNRFPTLAAAAPYAMNPKALAIKTYGGRMGNAPAPSEDGWINRGGGLTHHTGRAEYERVKKKTGYSPDDVRNPSNALAMVAAAGSYWQDRKVIPAAKSEDDRAVCKLINGGLIGFEDRMVVTRRYIAAFAGEPIPKARTRAETADRRQVAANATAGASGASGAAGTSAAVQEAPKPSPAAPEASGGYGAVIFASFAAALVLGGVAFWLYRKVSATRNELAIERQQIIEARAAMEGTPA